MANLNNHNCTNTAIVLNESEYWDLFLCKTIDGCSENRPAPISLFDFKHIEDADCIKGCKKHQWEFAVTTADYVLDNAGLTMMDDGHIKFDKDCITNEEFIHLFNDSIVEVPEDALLHLCKVDGNNKLYRYDASIENGELKLGGGFYQGYFKTEDCIYQVLPDRLEEDFNISVVLRKDDGIIEEQGLDFSVSTLNGEHPENKGIFFYIGTRAENKWSRFYDTEFSGFTESPYYKRLLPCETKSYREYLDLLSRITTNYMTETGCAVCGEEDTCGPIGPCTGTTGDTTSGDGSDCSGDTLCSDYVAEDRPISDVELTTSDGVAIDVNKLQVTVTGNKFISYHRGCDGFRAPFEGEDIMLIHDGRKPMFEYEEGKFSDNMFLVMNRTCTGLRASSNLEPYKHHPVNAYDIYKDLYENAFALQIKDDGSIGYKYYTHECVDGEKRPKIEQFFSVEGIIEDGKDYHVFAKLKPISETLMRVYIYVNGRLVVISKELEKLNLRKLNDRYEKQNGVPFNISLGGGTQGLADTIYPDYMSVPQYVLPLEEAFGGSFIGYIKRFALYSGTIEHQQIKEIYKKFTTKHG